MERKTILSSEIDEHRHAISKPLVFRVVRSMKGGSKGNLQNKPLAWAVAFPINGFMHLWVSVRKNRREWQDLNRLASELRGLGFVEYEVRDNLS